MAITIYLRSTTAHVGTLGSHGNNDLETTTGTTSTQSIGANTPRTFVYYSATSFPGLLDWQTGDYTYNIDVSTANANVQLTSLKVSRYDSTLTTERASGTATPNLTLSTTGLKTGTISFASPNPAGRAADDRLVLTITISKLAGGGTQSAVIDVNGSADSRLDTPLTIPVIRDISESSVSVSDSVARNALYVKPISNESSISANDSVQVTHVPGNTIYNVHFVEFPEDTTDQLLAVKLVAGDQVSTTKTHKYDVIEKITKSTTHKYNVIEQITTTKTHKFNIVTAVTATKTHLYNIIEKITQTKTHKYNIIAQVSAAKTHKYHVEGSVSTTKTHKFNILTQISTTKTHKYNILEAVSKSTTHKYNIIGRLYTTKTHKYHVEGRVSTTKTHKYNVEEALSQVTKNSTHIYNVLVSSTKTATHKYNIIALISKNVTHKFNITASITRTLTHKFNIIQKIITTKTHKYNLLNRVTPDQTKTHKYNIIQQIQRTRTHKYNIIGIISTTKTHKYHMGGVLVVSKTHKYDIGVAVGLQELGGSTNAFIRFPERVRIIDIIADLNNLAIANVQIPVSQPPANIAIAVVVIAEYRILSEGGFSLSRVASAEYKLKHRIASTLITPQVIDTIENRAIAPYIGIEILQPTQSELNRTRSQVQLYKTGEIHLSSQTQIKQDDKTKIKIASATTLQETQITKIASIANLQIPYNLSNALVKIPEIMTRERAKTIKTLIDLLNSDLLFE